jgi:hypothetical protein
MFHYHRRRIWYIPYCFIVEIFTLGCVISVLDKKGARRCVISVYDPRVADWPKSRVCLRPAMEPKI